MVCGGTPIKRAETATFRTHQKIPLILRPQSRDQVCEVIRIANRNGVPIYPVSTGRNWGYGSRVPVVSGCALVDLSGLKRIVDFNESLGYVTVQPGVTQRDLYNFLIAGKIETLDGRDRVKPGLQPHWKCDGARLRAYALWRSFRPSVRHGSRAA
jgi:UDP-N-acetylenolpyruvoylglucosamine reductase